MLPSDTAHAGHPAPVVMPAPSERQFDQLVGEFAVAADELRVFRPAEAELRELCRQVASFTSELFPGEMTIEVRHDREIPNDIYFVVDVSAAGSIDDVMARVRQWHFALHRTAGGLADLFCLSFDMR